MYQYKIILFLMIGLAFSFFGNAQVSLDFQPTYGNQDFELNKTYYLLSGDSLEFSVLRFYVSNIELKQSEETIWKERESYHLLDIEDLKTFNLYLKTPQNLVFDAIKFNLGIDSTTSSQGVMGGDLDPTKGMYWTWQSGYINFKLEGSSHLCDTYYNEFQLHIGGYQFPNNSLQTIELPFSEGQTIKIDIERFINKINLEKEHSIMTPGEKTMRIARLLPQVFIVE